MESKEVWIFKSFDIFFYYHKILLKKYKVRSIQLKHLVKQENS